MSQLATAVSDLCSRLCLTLAHSLWQVTVLAAAAWLIGFVLGRQRTNAQYGVYVAALLVGLLLAPITFTLLGDGPIEAVAAAKPAADVASAALPESPAPSPVARQRLPSPNVTASIPTSPSRAIPSAAETIEPPSGDRHDWRSLSPIVASVYAIGVLTMLLRLTVSAVKAERLGASAQALTEGPAWESLSALCRAMKIRIQPRLAALDRIVTPKVVGLLRPAILLPPSALTGLSAAELEMVLAHELAHLRRHDLWVNLAQRLFEAVLFYHPAAWWLSCRVSRLREYGCDEAACSAVGGSTNDSRVRYASALLHTVELERGKATRAELAALAASGRSPSELRLRVARLLGEPLREPLGLPRSTVLVVGLAVGALSLAGVADSHSAASSARDSKPVDDEAHVVADDTPAKLSGVIVLEDGSPSDTAGWLYSDVSTERSDGSGASWSKTEGRFTDTFECTTNPGSVVLKFFPAEGYAPAVLGPFDMEPGEQRSDLMLVLTVGHQYEVKVETDGYEPIEEATVIAHPLLAGSTNGPGLRQTTDRDGRVVLEHVAPETRYAFRVEAPGYETLRTEPRRMPSGGDEPWGPINLWMVNAQPAGGLVRFPDGSPASGTKFLEMAEVLDSGGSLHSSSPKLLATADGEGRFQLDSLRSDSEYVMLVEALDYNRVVTTNIEAGKGGTQITFPERHDMVVRVLGDLDQLPKRNGKPYVKTCQRFNYQFEKSGVGTFYTDYATLEPTKDGGQAIYRGLVIDLRDDAPPQQVEVMLGQDESTKQVVDIVRDADRGTFVEFDLGGEVGGVKDQPPKAEPQRLRVNIVGPDGNPVGNAAVEVRGLSGLDATRLPVGEVVEKRRYGVAIRADAGGRLELKVGDIPPRRLTLQIHEPGFGPYWASWNSNEHPDPIPAEFTARLEAGWRAGGVVIDESGRPIAGALVRPSIEYKKRPGDTTQLRVGTRVETGSDGVWRLESIPASYGALTVSVSHADYARKTVSIARETCQVNAESTPTAPIELASGLSITGRITDDAGAPIAGATVRTQFINDTREATTGNDGRYRLVGCEPKMTRVVVSAPGKAMDLREVRVDPDMEPVDFVMQNGGRVRVRVVDENGVGIPKARVFFQSWRGPIDYFEFDHVDEYTNDQGVWEWNEAPLDEFEADICRPGGMQLVDEKLVARDEEYVFAPPRKLKVTGRVLDAETGDPIEGVLVTTGIELSRQGNLLWNDAEAYEATDGRYRVAFNRVPGTARVRFEAVGYSATISRAYRQDEEQVVEDVKLKRAEAITPTLITAAGEPAADATIAVGVAGSQISIKNGRIGDGQTYAQRLEADADGRFRLPARDEPFQLVITHDAGFAHVKSADGPVPSVIRLTPWARVEGVFRVGAEPTPGVNLQLFSGGIHSHGPDSPNIFTQTNATTGPGGRYVFERVFPGKGRVGRNIVLMVNEGATEVTSSSRVPAEFFAGETTELDLGGDGRAVVGRLMPPNRHGNPILWNFALVRLKAGGPQPTAPSPPTDGTVEPAAWLQAWRDSAGGKRWTADYKKWRAGRDTAPYLTASVDRDGRFRFDNTPPGDYTLSVQDVQSDGRIPGTLKRRVAVPGGSVNAPPVDLGELRLQPPERAADVGASGPNASADAPDSDGARPIARPGVADIDNDRRRPKEVRVETPEGKPAEGATFRVVRWRDDGGDYDYGTQEPEQQVDARGTVVLSVPAGAERVSYRVEAAGYAAVGDELALAGAPVVRLRPGRVVRVLALDADGEPLKNAVPLIEDCRYYPQEFKPVADQPGMFESPVVSLDRRWMRVVGADADGRLLFSELIDLENPTALNDEGVLVAVLQPGARITGRLGDSVPRPVKIGCVDLYIQQGDDERIVDRDGWTWRDSAAIREDGTFEFPSVPPGGHVQLFALAEGYHSARPTAEELRAYLAEHDAGEAELIIPALGRDYLPRLFRLPERDASIAVELPCVPTAAADVRVVDPIGRPIENATVRFSPNVFFLGPEQELPAHELRPDSARVRRGSSQQDFKQRQALFNWAMSSFYRVPTNSDGIAGVHSLPADEQLTCRVEAEGYVMPLAPDSTPDFEVRYALLRTKAGQTLRRTITMERLIAHSTRDLAVVDSRGKPVAGVTVSGAELAFEGSEDDWQFWAVQRFGAIPSAETDAGGQLRFEVPREIDGKRVAAMRVVVQGRVGVNAFVQRKRVVVPPEDDGGVIVLTVSDKAPLEPNAFREVMVAYQQLGALESDSKVEMLLELERRPSITVLKRLLAAAGFDAATPLSFRAERILLKGFVGDPNPITRLTPSEGGERIVAMCYVRPKGATWDTKPRLRFPPVAAFVFDAGNGDLIAMVGGWVSSKGDYCDAALTELGTQGDYFIRSSAFEENGPFEHLEKWTRLGDEQQPLLTVHGYANATSWSAGSQMQAGYGYTSYSFNSQRIDDSLPGLFADDAVMPRKIYWDPATRLFVGPPEMSSMENVPLFRVSAAESPAFKPLAADPNELLAAGGRGRYDYWHTWDVIVPQGGAAKLRVEVQRGENVAAMHQWALTSGMHGVQLYVDQSPDREGPNLEVRIGGDKHKADLPLPRIDFAKHRAASDEPVVRQGVGPLLLADYPTAEEGVRLVVTLLRD